MMIIFSTSDISYQICYWCQKLEKLNISIDFKASLAQIRLSDLIDYWLLISDWTRQICQRGR